MKLGRWILIDCTLTLICSLFMLTGCQITDEDIKEKEQEKEKEQLTRHEMNKLSETMGHYLIENLYNQRMKLDVDSLIQGIRDAEAGDTPPLDKQEFFQELTRYREIIIKEIAAENLEAAEEFLKNNEEAEGVVILQEGKLQYEILVEGEGPEVPEDGTPLIHYEGKLLDGKVFESTQARGKPVPMPLNATFPGFKEGVSGMKLGEKRRLFIHPDLGFGNAGPLPPNSLLIFDVAIEEVEAKMESEQQQKKEDLQEEAKEQNQETSQNWIQAVKDKFF